MLRPCDEAEIVKLMQRWPHLSEKKAHRAARELLALRKFQNRIKNLT